MEIQMDSSYALIAGPSSRLSSEHASVKLHTGTLTWIAKTVGDLLCRHDFGHDANRLAILEAMTETELHDIGLGRSQIESAVRWGRQ